MSTPKTGCEAPATTGPSGASQWRHNSEMISNFLQFHQKKFNTLSFAAINFTIKPPAMHFTKLIPSIFYKDINIGLKTFVDCLEFTIGHEEIHSANPFCVVDKDGLSIMIFQNEEYAEKEHPELRLVTGDIEEVYRRVASKCPEMLHPNLNQVTLRPWGAKEFALLDGQIGIRFQQW